MTILGIDTSCDDTCISVLEVKNEQVPRRREKRFNLISNNISSQVKLHAKYGGVYPFLAKREHQKNLPAVFKKTLRQTQGKQIDLIAVTVGPGLEPCLWQGINFAVELAKKNKKPLILVNHIEAHILANFIGGEIKNCFPAICLVVSGGHTQLILMRDVGKYKLLGETRDDAAGECFDKAARILGLGYPGGPIVAKMAKFNPSIDGQELKFQIKLPRPMIYQKNYDFSFSGLKTAVLYDFKNRSLKVRKTKEYIGEISKEVQQSIIDVLIHKTLKTAKDYRVKSIILGGGVAANEELRKQFKEKIQKEIPNTKYIIPDTKYCTDNAAMVATTAYFHRKENFNLQQIKADANLRV